MKTPDEIKKGLECCAVIRRCNFDCPYRVVGDHECAEGMMLDALAYIQQLETELAQTKRERDAAISELKNSCVACRFVGKEFDDSPCEDCFQRGGKYPWTPMVRTKFEWRGICPENSKEDCKE